MVDKREVLTIIIELHRRLEKDVQSLRNEVNELRREIDEMNVGCRAHRCRHCVSKWYHRLWR